MYGYIYLTTNLINQKLYIGKKVSSKFDKNYKGSGTILQKAFQKYGKENFKVEIIEECEDNETLCQRERYWIRYHNAVKDPRYYNLTDGVTGIGYGKCTPEIKEKISKANSGKVRTPEMNAKMSLIRQGDILINNGVTQIRVKEEDFINNYEPQGWVHGHLPGRVNGPKSEEAKIKNSNSHKGKKHSGNWDKNQKQSFKNKKYHWYTNGIENLLLSESDNEEVPEGFYRGKFYSNKMGEKQHQKKGKYMWVTNGIENFLIPIENFQEYKIKGFYKGRVR